MARILSGIYLYARKPTYVSPQGIEFIFIKLGIIAVGKFQPTVKRGGMGSMKDYLSTYFSSIQP